MGLKENLQGLRPIDAIDDMLLYDGKTGEYIGNIPNAEGKRGSLQVYANVLGMRDGLMTNSKAVEALSLFSEHTITALADPHEHANIQRLFGTSYRPLRVKIVYNPGKIREQVEAVPTDASQRDRRAVQGTVLGLVNLLEQGKVRSADRDADGNWNANTWVKQGILYGFGACDIVPMEYGAMFKDKELFPPRDPSEIEGVRMVPGGSSVRGGAHLAKGVIVMPPAYVNVGAFVDEGTMLDSHSLGGSCAQVGKGCHISAGAQVGGVLEPANASPCIVEDNAFMGINTSIAEGTVLRERAILAPGVNITSSIPIYDRVNNKYVEKVKGKTIIPAGAVVVPGSRRINDDVSMGIAIIAKYRDEKTSASVALEDALR